jgi:hypothetical protein
MKYSWLDLVLYLIAILLFIPIAIKYTEWLAKAISESTYIF